MLSVTTSLTLLLAAGGPLSDETVCHTLARRIESESHIHPAASLYVTRVGDRLLKHLWHSRRVYRFRVVVETVPMIFSVCGGEVFLTTALLERLVDEHELAGLLGHEIIHSDERHLLRSPEVLSALRGIERSGGPVLFAARSAVGVLDEEFEEDADEDGVKLAMAAGYDGTALIRVLERCTRERSMPWAPGPPLAHRKRKIHHDVLKMQLLGFRVTQPRVSVEMEHVRLELEHAGSDCVSKSRDATCATPRLHP